MAKRYCLVLVLVHLAIVLAQDPEIVDEIWPEVQQVGRTGRLNCTVAYKRENVVFWENTKSGETISSDDSIVLPLNPMIGGLRKYEVQSRINGDRTTFMLVVRRLLEVDAGRYRCYVRIQATPVNMWPSKYGTITVQVPPTIRPGETTAVLQVDQRDNATLVCSASGIPAPNITWTKSDGGFLATGQAQHRSAILPITSVSVSDMGVYRCVADNNIKPPAEHLAQVLVFHAPSTRVVQDSVGQAQNRRFNAKLECIVKGHPEPTVTWQRVVKGGRYDINDDDKFSINKQTTDNQNLKAGEQWYTLKVKNVQANDFTDYYCIGTNIKGTNSSKIVLFETPDCQGPNCPSLPTSSSSIMRPSTLIFLAAAVLLIRRIRVALNTSDVPRKTKLFKLKLFSDLTNIIVIAPSRTMWKVLVLVFGVILAISPINGQDPEIVDDILPEVQRVGGTARLNCTVVNLQTNNVFWLNKATSETISMDSNIVLQYNPMVGGLRKYDVERRMRGDRQTFMLIIRRLLQQDAGQYECQVKIQNQNNLTPVKKIGILTVQVPPSILPGETTTVLQIDEGENATLRCEATGIPSPNITWTRSDGKLLPTGSAQFRGKYLPLKTANVNHTGVYRCVADNNIKPPDEHLCSLEVFHAPTARVVQDSVGQAQGRRLSARLDCIVNGFPTPEVRWERTVKGGRVEIRDNDFFVNVKQTTDNQNMMAGEQWYTLKVKNVQANDYTDYYCIAHNSKGKTEVTIVLFETPDCQGPNCPSLLTSRGSSAMLAFSMAFICFLLHALARRLR
ncbi:hemicentin-1-like [Pomacea canaliculata]|uniref:hemicentin-1-like n=1 Tax=Pomacea canaliculata TaxID=400727 RepID=UPI000D7262E5|nr:hemicentin-1-like [Pomacea canaliculata]